MAQLNWAMGGIGFVRVHGDDRCGVHGSTVIELFMSERDVIQDGLIVGVRGVEVVHPTAYVGRGYHERALVGVQCDAHAIVLVTFPYVVLCDAVSLCDFVVNQ